MTIEFHELSTSMRGTLARVAFDTRHFLVVEGITTF